MIEEAKKLFTHDGRLLRQSLARSLFMEKFRSFMLVLPLVTFISVFFVAPVFDMLFRSVENRIVSQTLPRTVSMLQRWDENSNKLPRENVYRAMVRDLRFAFREKKHTKLGVRLNYELAGASSLFRKTGRKIRKIGNNNTKEQLLKIHKSWGKPDIWRVIKQNSDPYTANYFLSALDLQRTNDGAITLKGEDKRIYIKVLLRTLYLSLIITLGCLLLGYPIAYLMANTRTSTSNILMIFVLLPFWTSLLARTSAWKILLQQQGVVNDILVFIGLVSDNARLELINNQFGTLVAMTHILLPFMVLPLYSVMKSISPSYVTAAKSLGANDWTAFWRVYFPNSKQGVVAGCMLVFVISIGYYVTPDLVGGTEGILIGSRIAYHISSSLNWGLASALGAIVLSVVAILYWLYIRTIGVNNLIK